LVPSCSKAIQNHIILSDGRRLSFAEFGDRQGTPVFYFHGFPGSRLEAKLAEKISLDTHVRFIDVSELADAMGIDRFSILGVSGGGPYAAACACKIPHRLDTVGIICGMGPVDVPGLMRDMPWMHRQGLRLAGRSPTIAAALYPFAAFFFRNYPERMLSILSAKVAEPDKIALKNTELINVLSASFREAFRSSLMWPASDVVLYSRPWGFLLKDINIAVHLWHGEKDWIVPPEIGRYMAQAIPDCRATFYPDEGHFSLILNRIEEILKIFCI
jgi:pimeloyl-ACP methyl ester carboxylesterase